MTRKLLPFTLIIALILPSFGDKNEDAFSEGERYVEAAKSETQRLERLILPKVQIHNLPIDEAIHKLAEITREADPKGVQVMLWHYKKNEEAPHVTFDFKNVKFLEILQLLADAINGEYRITPDTVIIQNRSVDYHLAGPFFYKIYDNCNEYLLKDSNPSGHSRVMDVTDALRPLLLSNDSHKTKAFYHLDRKLLIVYAQETSHQVLLIWFRPLSESSERESSKNKVATEDSLHDSAGNYRIGGQFKTEFLYVGDKLALIRSVNYYGEKEEPTIRYNLALSKWLNEPELADQTGDSTDKYLVNLITKLDLISEKEILIGSGSAPDTEASYFLVKLPTRKVIWYKTYDELKKELEKLGISKFDLSPIEQSFRWLVHKRLDIVRRKISLSKTEKQPLKNWHTPKEKSPPATD